MAKHALDNVRPRMEEHKDDFDSFEDGLDDYGEDDDLETSEVEAGSAAEDGSEDGSGDSEQDVMSDQDEEEDGDDADNVQEQISHTSFSTLKRAQETLSNKRKRGSDTTEQRDEKLAALRARLGELREKSAHMRKDYTAKYGDYRDRTRTQRAESPKEDDSDASDSDSAPSEVGATARSRSSKHAPAVQSSRYQVTRKRTVVDAPKRSYRDPRFDALRSTTQPANLKDNSEKAYAFLDDYQRDEIAELKKAMKAKDISWEDREALTRKVVSMQNKLKAKAAREREREVVRKFRREEKGRVEEGKTPFYLKRGEVKKKALEEKYREMGGKEREKAVERRRVKEGQREKKRMPGMRRVER